MSNIEETSLPPEMCALRKIYEDGLEKRDYQTLSIFYNNLVLQTLDYIKTGNSAVWTELAQLWLDNTQLDVNVYMNSTLSDPHRAELFELLTRAGVLETLCKEPRNKLLIAGLCLQAVCEEDPDNKVSSWKLAEVLAGLLGKSAITTYDLFAPEQLTTLLYGPAAWGLFSQDVEIADLPLHLCKLGVPLLGLPDASLNKLTTAEVDLPQTF